jgi:tetratricopeptide (TPR) repeat protein
MANSDEKPHDAPAPIGPHGEGELAPTAVTLTPPSEDSGKHSAGRYLIHDAIAGDLHQGRDRLLDRAVQVRVADTAQAGELEREARFVARLAHPSVLPVHDFVHGDGGAILVQEPLEGVTLAAAITAARAGSVRAELATPTAVVQTIRKVCDALAAAHARGVVHRAVTPASITLGWHGQVILTEWKASLAASERPLTRRFVADVPAPKATELDDLHTDVRAVGGCLHEALLWRPLASRAGNPLDGLNAEERRRLPPPLAAIVRHAVNSDQSIGYHSMAELGEDLDRYLAGVPLDAYEPGMYLRLSAWVHRHRRGVRNLAVTALVVLVMAAGAAWAVDRYLDRWGPPIVEETFSDGSWRDRWTEVGKGSFLVDKGRLVSQAPRQALLVFRERLVAPVAIEYTGQLLPGARPCDVSVWWNEREGGPEDAVKPSLTAPMYMIQAGAVDNSYCAIFEQPLYRRVAHANRQLEQGRDYHFRVEIDGDRIAMSIDGQRVMEYRSRFPATSGHLMLYGYYPGKAFDDVRIFRKPARAASPLAAGDVLYQYRHFDEAAAVYQRFADAHPGQPDSQLALFRKGLAERGAQHADVASQTWLQLTDAHLSQLADCLRLEDLLTSWQIDTLVNRFGNYYRERSGVRAELRLQWQQLMQLIMSDERRDEATVLRIIGLRDSLFPDDSATAYEAANAMLRLDRYEQILAAFPEERAACANARLALGRTDEMLSSPLSRAAALVVRGDYDAVLQLPDLGAGTRALVMCKRGWAREALRDTGESYPSLLHMGRADELLASLVGSPLRTDLIANDCLIALGRYAEAAGGGCAEVPSGRSARAMLLLGQIDEAEKRMRIGDYWSDPLPVEWARLLVAAEAGKADEVARLRPLVVLPRNLSRAGGWFAGMVIGPFIDQLAGDHDALTRAMSKAVVDYAQVFSKRPWFLARYVLGQCSNTDLLAMPAAVEGPAWLAVGDALRAEIAGRPADALAAYTTFAELPRHQRLIDGNTLDVQVELFVAWRLRALARP